MKTLVFIILLLFYDSSRSELVHKTPHNVEAVNSYNLKYLGNDRAASNSAQCNINCNKKFSHSFRSIQKFFTQPIFKCDCYEAEKLNNFRLTELMDDAKFSYDGSFF